MGLQVSQVIAPPDKFLDPLLMYHPIKNKVSMSRYSKVIAQSDVHIHTQTDTRTHRQYENITCPHTRAVNIFLIH